MARGLRACPICPDCSAKKFKVIEKSDSGKLVTVECLNCSRRIVI